MIYGGNLRLRYGEGQLRCDAPTSPSGPSRNETRDKVELKNLNSISFVRDGIAHENQAPARGRRDRRTLVQETRDYDGQTGTSQSLRSKEMAHDYRYFPIPT